MHVTLVGRQERIERWPPAVTAKLQVSVDGDTLRDPIGFDTHRGWVDVLARDDRGRVVRLGRTARVRRIHGSIRACIRRATVLDVERLAARGVVIA